MRGNTIHTNSVKLRIKWKPHNRLIKTKLKLKRDATHLHSNESNVLYPYFCAHVLFQSINQLSKWGINQSKWPFKQSISWLPAPLVGSPSKCTFHTIKPVNQSIIQPINQSGVKLDTNFRSEATQRVGRFETFAQFKDSNQRRHPVGGQRIGSASHRRAWSGWPPAARALQFRRSGSRSSVRRDPRWRQSGSTFWKMCSDGGALQWTHVVWEWLWWVSGAVR